MEDKKRERQWERKEGDDEQKIDLLRRKTLGDLGKMKVKEDDGKRLERLHLPPGLSSSPLPLPPLLMPHQIWR